MRFLRFRHTSLCPEGSYGVLTDGKFVTLLRHSPLRGVELTETSIPLDGIDDFLPPVDPPNIIALGANYAAHAKEGGGEVPDHPVLFLKATTSLNAHGKNIVLPKTHPHEVDYEAELAIVIGKRAKHVNRADAADVIFGYACAHDVSARDCQKRIDKQWARAKSFDTFCPLGPILDTDIDPANLRVRMRLNGETMQDQSTADLLFDVPAIVEYVSSAMTLLPGTVILTGTPSGVGMARTPPVFLRPGDVTEVDIQGLGVLRNTVVAESEA